MSHLSRTVRVSFAVLVPVIACLWALAAAGAWLIDPGPRGEAFLVAAATTVSVLGGQAFWTLVSRDRDKDALVRAMADLSLHAAKAPTALRRVG